MRYKINAYFAALLVTIIGAGASLILVHVAFTNTFETTLVSGGAYYDQFR